jgi:hypothetical protein
MLNWSAILDRVELRAREAGVAIDAQQMALALGDFGDAIQALPTIMQECEVDAVILEQRLAEIERLATSLVDLPRTEVSSDATRTP